MKPQCEKLLAALRKGPMTTLEIQVQLGIGRPASRIDELRKARYDIETERVTVKNRLHEDCHVAKYTLRAEPETRAA